MQSNSCPAYTYITTLHSVQDRTELSSGSTDLHLPLTVDLKMPQIFFYLDDLVIESYTSRARERPAGCHFTRPRSGIHMKSVPCGHPVISRQDAEPLRSPAGMLHRKQLAASIPHACHGHNRCKRAYAQAQENSPVSLAGRLRDYSRAETSKVGSGK